MALPVLVATAHGTDNPVGQEVISSVVAQAQALLPDTKVLETYVDVQYPQVDEVLEGLSAQETAVVVPLLLSTGYHTVHDIAGAVRQRNRQARDTVGTSTLGPHSALAEIQVDRIAEATDRPTHVILIAAGSSDARAQEDITAQAELLRIALSERHGEGAPAVSIGYLSASSPTVSETISAAVDAYAVNAEQPTEPVNIVLSSYLLGPGFFQNKLHKIAAEPLTIEADSAEETPEINVLVTEPLGADPRLAQIVVERYQAAL
ncbi:sirohydrochlorin chelatase [Populibacterium corticicola]|uniref:Sirohydrochlorin chelatase n=1 Tax=Populibacterium corticicola TaxID=1812826 RepID=A0ABW5XG68_9MICO